jgi:hypothetical protein
VSHFGPPAGLLGQNLETGHGCNSEKLLDPIGGEGHIKVLGDAGRVPMTPDRPSASKHGFALHALKNSINSSDRARESPREVLRLEHGCSPRLELLRQLDDFSKLFESGSSHRFLLPGVPPRLPLL